MATRAVVIGTAETAAWAAGQLRAADAPGPDGPLELLGVVLTGPDAELPPSEQPADASHARTGLPVLGPADRLGAILPRAGADLAVVCLPAAMSAVVARVRAELDRAGVAARWLPTIGDVLAGARPAGPGGPGPSRLADPDQTAAGLDLAALVGRPPLDPDDGLIRSVVANKRVAITGAGGSIGSELARRCAAYNPDMLVVMDRAENPLFEIDRTLRERFPTVRRKTILHDVVDGPGARRWFTELAPDVVFHAAAHKHVPLMQDHPAAAVTNNLFGTRAVADAARDAGVARFVMISTDKAVHPTSVMGATKRLAERYVRALDRHPDSATRFALVRFGNVLGSACSVLPIWARQAAEGGPITITDARMSRYFMTIPEAALLVIQSAALLDEPGAAPVYVLDMGEPVGIAQLARRFARQLGMTPRFPGDPEPGPGAAAMPVAITGARPGEKIHEELAHGEESLEPTAVPGVLAWRGESGADHDAPEAVARMIEELDAARSAPEPRAVIEAIGRWLPGFEAASARAAGAAQRDEGVPDSTGSQTRVFPDPQKVIGSHAA